MRYTPEFEKNLNDNAKSIGLRTPCVGLVKAFNQKIFNIIFIIKLNFIT